MIQSKSMVINKTLDDWIGFLKQSAKQFNDDFSYFVQIQEE